MRVARIQLWWLFGLAAPAWAQDVDTDRDGIPDAKDACPTAPEDKNGYLDADGCPDERARKLLDLSPDADHDGVPDATDKCPLVPENLNQFQDDDGCPESIYDSLTFEASPTPKPAATPTPTPAPTPKPAPSSGVTPRAPTVGGDPICHGTAGATTSSPAGTSTLRFTCADGRVLDVSDAPTIPIGTTGILYCEDDTLPCHLRVLYVDASRSYYGEGCFFTTAVARVRGEPDDGPTLTALRAFRDGPLAGHPDVATYYRIAPAIVAFVEAQPDPDAIWRAVDAGWIRPIVADLAAGAHARAYARYRHLVQTLVAVQAAA